MTQCMDFPSPLGVIRVKYDTEAIVSLEIKTGVMPKPSHTVQDGDLCKRIVAELENYFRNPASPIALKLNLKGTPFQKKVWRALCSIKSGRTLTYGELAAQLGSSARAVGNACRANPVALIVPCHRVIAKQGIGGYAGKTQGAQIRIKHWLLQHEGVCL